MRRLPLVLGVESIGPPFAFVSVRRTCNVPASPRGQDRLSPVGHEERRINPSVEDRYDHDVDELMA